MFAVSKNNPHRGGMLTCAHMLPPSSQRKSSQKRDFELGLHASHHLKNNPPKGRIPKRWDKNLVQEILPEGGIINRVLLIEGYLHVSTFYSVCGLRLFQRVNRKVLWFLIKPCHLYFSPSILIFMTVSEGSGARQVSNPVYYVHAQ